MGRQIVQVMIGSVGTEKEKTRFHSKSLHKGKFKSNAKARNLLLFLLQVVEK